MTAVHLPIPRSTTPSWGARLTHTLLRSLKHGNHERLYKHGVASPYHSRSAKHTQYQVDHLPRRTTTSTKQKHGDRKASSIFAYVRNSRLFQGSPVHVSSCPARQIRRVYIVHLDDKRKKNDNEQTMNRHQSKHQKREKDVST